MTFSRPQRIHHPDYNNELTQFLPRTIILKKPPGAQLGFNIRGGKASQLGIFISKVRSCVLTGLWKLYLPSPSRTKIHV